MKSLAVALAVLALVVPMGSSRPGRAVSISGRSPFAAICQISGAATNQIGTAAEASVAVDPRSAGSGHPSLIAAWEQDRATPAWRGIATAYSHDGGRTWTETVAPFSLCAPNGLAYPRAMNPWVSIGLDGVAYLVGIGVTPTTPQRPGDAMSRTALIAARSVDGGRTWTDAQVITSVNFPGAPAVVADRVRPGAAYVVWQDSRNAWFAKTTDSGATWTRPTMVVTGRPAETGVSFNRILVGPGTGTLYDVFDLSRRSHHGSQRAASIDFHNYVAEARSTDGGARWSRPRIIALMGSAVPSGSPFPRCRIDGASFIPSAAIDARSGALYAVWQDVRPRSKKLGHVIISASQDEGVHWSQIQRVPSPSGSVALDPTVAVDSRGIVAVTYYTVPRRSVTVPSGDRRCTNLPGSYWVVLSGDGGSHFGRPLRIAGALNIARAPTVLGSHFLGDYEGLTAAGPAFQAVFAAPASGVGPARSRIRTVAVEPGGFAHAIHR